MKVAVVVEVQVLLVLLVVSIAIKMVVQAAQVLHQRLLEHL
jgi:hypothetical protein